MQQSQKKNMAESQLFTQDIEDKRILEIMGATPRDEFVPAQLAHCAYVDEELQVGGGRAQMQPLVFAKLLDLAEIKPSCRVLTIGCLQGYSAAILSQLAGHVVAIDTDGALVEQARIKLARMGTKDVDIQQVSSLALGYGQSAPYDVIVVEGAVDVIPHDLATQLSSEGRLVTVKRLGGRPGARGGMGRGIVVKRMHGHLSEREHFDAAATLLPGFETPAGFRF